jgi:aromatic ring-opening dioxygenase catalytic subunit (LigB family)
MENVLMRFPTYFISHGGGPWPWLDDWRPMMRELEQSLVAMPGQFGAVPKAMLVVSGHWEAHDIAVMAAPRPPMVYDYYGFPAHTFQIKYPAPGAPALAQRTVELLTATGIAAHLDPARGFDHGTFAPLYPMYPQADMPIFQVSLRSDLDPAAHLAIGRALAPLRDEGVVIVGSGLSYHNLGAMGPQARGPSAQFDAWLQDTLVASPPAVRSEKLVKWREAPAARFAHPREDHLLPLHVAVGAAEADPATLVYHQTDFFGAVTVSSFRFG